MSPPLRATRDLPPGTAVATGHSDARPPTHVVRRGDLGGAVKPDDSVWTLEDGQVRISLEKARKGETWPCVIEGHGGGEETEEDRRRLMLQRFQEENPGFDFSQAEFNGAVPDASTFMGGQRHG